MTVDELRVTREEVHTGPHRVRLAQIVHVERRGDGVRLRLDDGREVRVAIRRPEDTRRAIVEVLGRLASRARAGESPGDRAARARLRTLLDRASP